MDRPNMSVGVVLQSHHGRVHRLAVHPIIRFLVASISSDKTIRLWDFNDRVLVSSFVAVDLLTAVTFSPDGSSLVVGAANGDISVYQCEVLTQCISQFSNQSSSSPSSSWRLDLSNAQWMISRKRNIMLKQSKSYCYMLIRWDVICWYDEMWYADTMRCDMMKWDVIWWIEHLNLCYHNIYRSRYCHFRRE